MIITIVSISVGPQVKAVVIMLNAAAAVLPGRLVLRGYPARRGRPV